MSFNFVSQFACTCILCIPYLLRSVVCYKAGTMKQFQSCRLLIKIYGQDTEFFESSTTTDLRRPEEATGSFHIYEDTNFL